MQYYYIKKNFRNKYGNYDRYMVFLFEDNLKQFQKYYTCYRNDIFRHTTTNLEEITYDT